MTRPAHIRHAGFGAAHADVALGTLRADLLRFCHALADRGWVANHDGNISLRLPGGRLLCTPTAMHKALVREQDLIVVDRENRVLQGHRRPFSELALHRAVYAARPDVHAVVHHHGPSSCGLAIAGHAVEPRMMPEPVVSLGDRVPLLPYAAPGAKEAVEAVRQAADEVDAVTMEHHGVLAWGPDLELAFLRAELVEHLATMQLRAMQAGGVRTIPAADVETLLAKRRKAGLGPPR